ncbi:MAG: hypothetical protein KC729_13040, partial [Candidatus Eisenbacteria bacterium]|nr:hypothetical protein [Candidatus Eisenbacteria bacterium]
LDVAGRHVARLGERLLGVGDHEIVWNGRDRDGTTVPSGVYWLKTEDGRVSTGLRVVVVR